MWLRRQWSGLDIAFQFEGLTSARSRCRLRGMGADRYWSVEACCWVDCPGSAERAEPLQTSGIVPGQREAAPTKASIQESADA